MESLVSIGGTVVRVLVPDQYGLGSDPATGVIRELLSGLRLLLIPIVAPQFVQQQQQCFIYS